MAGGFNVQTSPNARYSLAEAIDVAIENVIARQRPLSAKNVMIELEEMSAANDVRLPYSYSSKTKISSSGKATTKVWLTVEQQKKKDDLHRFVAVKIQQFKETLQNTGNAANVKVIAEPTPQQFKTKNEYVEAYVGYKLEDVDEATKDSYMKKLGGMNTFKREMRKEANVKWSKANLK